jgi:hypothetical protein
LFIDVKNYYFSVKIVFFSCGCLSICEFICNFWILIVIELQNLNVGFTFVASSWWILNF